MQLARTFPLPRWRGAWLLRAVWLALLLAALAAHVWLVRLPFPLEAGSAAPLAAAPGEHLLLVGPATTTPLLSYAGRPGEAVDVRFERARLSPETLALLRSAGLEPPSEELAFEWLSDAAGDSRSEIRVRLRPTAGGEARVALFQLPEAERRQPYLELRAEGAELTVTMAAAGADPFAADAPTRRLVAGARSWTLPAALPLELRVAEGRSLRLRVLPRGEGGSEAGRFVLGADEGAGALRLRAAGVVAGEEGSGGTGFPMRQFACSAPPRGPYARGAHRLAQGICDRGPSVPALAAARLEVDAERLALALRGRAWIARDGVAVNAPLPARLRAEPALVATVLGADLALALAAGLPLYRALRGRRAEPAPGIFISYRRADAIAHARLIADGLAARFGAGHVFIDLEDIQPGERFRQRIADTLARCQAVVVVIGPGWLAASRDGRRRLDDPDDVVRHEIAQALKLRLTVVPVLVGGAALPRPQELPAELAGLLEHSALALSDERLKEDLARLAAALEPAAAGAD